MATPENTRLKKALDKDGPQYWNEEEEDYRITRGNRYAPYSAILGPNGEELFTKQNPAQVEITGDDREFYGRSGEIKPLDVPVGSRFLEVDTREVYIFDGERWEVF